MFFFLPFKSSGFHSFRTSGANKIINTRRSRGWWGKGGTKRRAFRTCKTGTLPSISSPSSSSPSLASHFPSFPHQDRSGGRLYTPLQRLDVHYIQLGYFSREFSHVNAARARTFAHTSTKFAVHVALLTHTDSRDLERWEWGGKRVCRNLARKFRSPPRD